MKSTFITLLLIGAAFQAFCQDDDNYSESKRKSSGIQSSFNHLPYAMRNSGSYSRHCSYISFGYGVGLSSKVVVSGNIATGSGPTPNAFYSSPSNFGALYLKYEHGITSEIGVGVSLSYASSTSKLNSLFVGYPGYEDAKITTINGSALGFYHFNKFIDIENLDIYVGLGFGIRDRNKHDNPLLGEAGADFLLVGKAGVRYLFTHHFGTYAELSADGMSAFNFGISLGNIGFHPRHRNKVRVKRPSNENTEQDNDDEESSTPSKRSKAAKNEDE